MDEAKVFVTSSIWLFLVCKYGGAGNIWEIKSLAVMSGESADTWEPLFHCMNSQLINQTQEWGLTVVTHSVQWFAMQLINHLIYASFLPQRTGIFRPQKFNYLAYACCMKPGCSEMIQSVSPHRAARNTSLLHHSLLTTYYHNDTMLTTSLFPWCAAYISLVSWCRLVRRNSVELNFVKIGLKFKFGVNSQSFSHELCLCITRFRSLWTSLARSYLSCGRWVFMFSVG